MTDKETTELIYKMLEEQHYEKYSSKGRNWITIREARSGTGYSALNMRSFDFLAISSKAGNEVIGYEVKASRADFLNDLKDPEKQKSLRCFARRFYYVAPKGIIKPEELPAWAGLYELSYSEAQKNWYLTKSIEAPEIHNFPPTWGFVAACIRNSREAKVWQLMKERDELNEKIRSLESELYMFRIRGFRKGEQNVQG